jgi:hypothetical protein
VPEFQRLSFVLIGVATPSDLIRDPQRTPFNIGQRVDLTDFTYVEAMPLADGLGLSSDDALQVLHWVMNWTGGHPYLTQRLCREIADQDRGRCSEHDVDSAVKSSFFEEMSERDHNLRFVRDMLTKRGRDPGDVLAIYREILLGHHPVHDEEQSLAKSLLKLSGVVRRDNDVLRVRNQIYEEVFDLQWVEEHRPLHWIKRIPLSVIGVVIGLIAFLFIALVLLAMFARMQQQLAEIQRERAQEAQAVAEAQAKARAEAEQQARLAASRELATAAINNLNTDPERSVLLALHAVSVTYSADKTVTTEAKDALDRAVHPLLGRLTLAGHRGAVYGIAFSPDGTRLATASWDGTAKVWEVASGRELRTLSGHTAAVEGIAFSPDGTRLATASADKTVRFYDLDIPYIQDIQDLMALARMRVTRSLTSEECQKYLHVERCPPMP